MKPVVFDIDGTLTSEPYTEDNLLTVEVNPTLLAVALKMQQERPLVISTARPDRYRAETEKWLEAQGLKPQAVYMRDEGRDLAADQMIKFGHLQDIRKVFDDPCVWIDDNDANVFMLQKNNVPVIHVKKWNEPSSLALAAALNIPSS